MVLWAVFMLEYWKRKEKDIALQRGMLDYEDTEIDRPGKKINTRYYSIIIFNILFLSRI